MKKFLNIIASLVCINMSMAQIQITPYIDCQKCSSMPDGTCEILFQKLDNIVMQNGIQSRMGQSRFVMTCNVTEESKEVISTVPTQIAYVLDINLIIGDGETGTKYTNESFRTKGIGQTEEKAYRNAIKNLGAKSNKMKNFVNDGKARILAYYEENREKILSSVQASVDGKDLERASYELFLIPQECSYYDDVQKLMGKINGRIVDNNSSDLLLKAKSIWASEQNENTANQVADIITQIDANATCYSDAHRFMKSVTERMEQLNNREWIARQRQLKHEREMEMIRENNRTTESQMSIKAQKDIRNATIRAVRDVAVEYAKHRPHNVYNIHGWY